MRLDLHVHTRHSGDSLCTAEAALKKAKDKGLDGIAITDHNNCRGWEEARAASRKLGMELILGEEVRVQVMGRWIGEIIGYFLERPIKAIDPEAVIREIKEQGGVAVVAHPFDSWRGFERMDRIIGLVDGLEVMNSRATEEANRKALETAGAHKLAGTGGSDAHSAGEVGNAWTEADVKDLEEFRKALLEGKVKAGGKESSKLVRVFSTIAKVQKLANIQKSDR